MLVGKGVEPDTVFGVLDKADPGHLPLVTGGYWLDHLSIDETRFKFRAPAKASIAANGYYLMGGSILTITEREVGPSAVEFGPTGR